MISLTETEISDRIIYKYVWTLNATLTSTYFPFLFPLVLLFFLSHKSPFTYVHLEGLSGSWKDNGSGGPFTPSSNSSSGGYWSWSAPSDQSNPSTPSPPLSADSFKPFRVPSLGGVGPGPAGPEDPSLEEQDGSSLLFDEPIPRKRKVNTVVCIWQERVALPLYAKDKTLVGLTGFSVKKTFMRTSWRMQKETARDKDNVQITTSQTKRQIQSLTMKKEMNIFNYNTYIV